ncbi:ankyrin repeat domain-containing protein 26-like isoform X2 [Amblyraja radiata]|uniref:ankyrin repeat domain-containing protein 26-like isoform X2 n=1 Tax=Amblyraja radiata TaxID=386614 RepID=UPI001401BEB4|nr:ankyrin repeat domain-containing protein 26-like isoform X2 [Amblyraja radiata]
MRRILSFAKKKKRLSPNTSDNAGEMLVGYELKGKDLGKLHKAASVGDLTKLRQLIKKNNINELDKQNRAPLHLACARGHADVVTLLVENKSKLNICDNENRSPLMKAVQCEQEDCAVILLGHDADPNLVDINGQTALHLAAMIPNISLVMHLLEHGANINAQDKDGCTPLLLAITAKHQEMAEYILKKGADVNARDRTGRTALMIAASNGQINLVKLLLHYGIDASLKEDKGWTAEDHALMNGHHACSHLIIEHNTKKRLQSPHYGPRKIKGVPNTPDHAAKVNIGFGGPAIDKEMIDDVSQIESFSGESKSSGDSWFSSTEEDGLECSSKTTQKLNLTKLINSSQQNKENMNEKTVDDKAQRTSILQPADSDTIMVEDLENDCQDEEEINKNGWPTSPLQARTSLRDSPKTVSRSLSFPFQKQVNSIPLKGKKEGMSGDEQEAQSLKMRSSISRIEAIDPVFSEPSPDTILVQKTSPRKNRRDLLLELGLDEAEAEENTESPKDSESVTDISWKKSIGSLVSAGVLSHMNIRKNQDEDDSNWDSESASDKNVSPTKLPCDKQMRKVGKMALQTPNEELSNIDTPINKPKTPSEEIVCDLRPPESEGSADSLKPKLSSYLSTQNQLPAELQHRSDINAKTKNGNVCEWQMSPIEDNKKENNSEWKNEDKRIFRTTSIGGKLYTECLQSENETYKGTLLIHQKAEEMVLNEKPKLINSGGTAKVMRVEENNRMAIDEYVKVQAEEDKRTSHQEILTAGLKESPEEIHYNKNGAGTTETSEDWSGNDSCSEYNEDIVIPPSENKEVTVLEEELEEENINNEHGRGGLNLIKGQQESQGFFTEPKNEQQTFKIYESNPTENHGENSMEHICALKEVSAKKELNLETVEEDHNKLKELSTMKGEGNNGAGYFSDLDSDEYSDSHKMDCVAASKACSVKKAACLSKALMPPTELVEFPSSRNEDFMPKCFPHLNVRHFESPDMKHYPRTLPLTSMVAAKPYLDEELEDDMQHFTNEVGMLKVVFLALEKKKLQLQKEINVVKVNHIHQHKSGNGDSSKQLPSNLMTSVHIETPTETFLSKDKKRPLFKGINLGSNEENSESHQRNQPKQADQELKSIELKNIERLVRLQQMSAMNALSAFDDSTASEMSQDEERAVNVCPSKTLMKPVNISDDLNDLTESSGTATGGSEYSDPGHRNTAQLIAQLDSETVDSVSLLKIQNKVQEDERAVEREKKRYSLLSEKVKYLENERKELHQTLKGTREIKSKLECQIVEKDIDLNRLKFSTKQEQKKRKTAEMLCTKSRDQLEKKEFQYCEEMKAKHELELTIRNLEMERETLITNLQQLSEQQKELQSQFNKEQVQEEILNNSLQRRQEIEVEDSMAVKKIEPLAQCDNTYHEKAGMQQNCALQEEVTKLKFDLHCVREQNQEVQEKYLEQIETLKVKLDDAKKDLKCNEDTLTQNALQYNGQLNSIKTEVSMLTSKLELEKQNKDYLENEKEAIHSRLKETIQELECIQEAKSELERILQREHDEHVHSDEKMNNEISNLHESNSTMSQRLSKEEEKANDLDKKLHCATLSFAEKSLLLQSVQKDLKQSQIHLTEQEQMNKVQKEQISKYEICKISLQERLAQAHSDITLLRQQLEDAQNKGIMKEKAAADVQDRFNDMFTTLRGDSEQRISLMEKRNEELMRKNIEQREQMCKFENEKIGREATLRQLQQELADSLKKLSMSEASLEVITRSRNEMEDEKLHLQKQLEKLKVKLQETQDKNMQLERNIHQLENALDDKERNLIANSWKIQEAVLASSQRTEATKQLEEHIQRLEIENAKLDAFAKQQTNKFELMEKELQETESVRARLEDLITSLQAVKINLEDQLNQELQKQMILSQNAKDSHQLWEEELKSRSKLGLRLFQLDKEKNDLSDQVDSEKKKVKKLAEVKQAVETRLAHEMTRNNELQKELSRMRTLLKTIKKKLKDNETGQFVAQFNSIQELDQGGSETVATITEQKSKIHELSNQLEVESVKCKRLESTNQELSEQVIAMRVLQKNHDQLEKRKQQLEEEVLSLKNQIETRRKDYSRLENYKRKTEEQARNEIKQKLEEVNAFFQTHHASKETLDHLKASNELESRNELEQKNKDLQIELNKFRDSHLEGLNLKESTQMEIERYKELYSEELKRRKSIAANLDRSNERLAETNAKLLKERIRSKSFIADSIHNKGLTTTHTLNESHLESILGNCRDLGPTNRILGSNLNPAEGGIPPSKKVESYLIKMQDELQKSITKELAQANADLDSACSRISPLGSAACSLASPNQVQDPVATATEQYLEVLKKNYMI